MSWTCQNINKLAPNSDSETAIVMIMAMVMVTFRHRPTMTSARTYFARIETLPHTSAVDAASLITHDPPRIDLDHPTAHLVDDVGVVGDHHDRGPGPVDPVQQPHDLNRGIRFEVSRWLIGQQNQRPVDERSGHGHPLLL